MSIRIVGASVCLLFLFSEAACNNTNCEQGAYCVEGEAESPRRAGRECLLYCGKLTACDADEAADFDGCVADCEARFESDPETTAVLCACSEWSSCHDVKERRCSEPPNHGSGGGSGTGGASGGSAGSGGAPDAGSEGSGGSAPIPCGRDCDCPLPDVCVGGFCTAPDA